MSDLTPLSPYVGLRIVTPVTVKLKVLGLTTLEKDAFHELSEFSETPEDAAIPGSVVGRGFGRYELRSGVSRETLKSAKADQLKAVLNLVGVEHSPSEKSKDVLLDLLFPEPVK